MLKMYRINKIKIADEERSEFSWCMIVPLHYINKCIYIIH